MAVSWNNLPPELWAIVFQHVQSIKTVAICRLVCKAWDPIAERAMFSKSLSVYKEDRIVKLYNRLQENPSLRYYIHSLYLRNLKKVPPSVQESLYKLVLNPNIVSFSVEFNAATFTILWKAVKESDEQCSKLKSFNSYGVGHNDDYLNILLHFKKSLREMRLSFYPPQSNTYDTLVDQLDQFSNLEKLHLSYSDRHLLLELERFLRKCQHLVSIYFDIGLGQTHWISKAALEEWMLQNAQQSSALQSVRVGEIHHPHLVEYLIFKYSTLGDVIVTGASSDRHGTIGRILDAIKDVKLITLRYWHLNTLNDVEQVILAMKSNKSTVILRPCSTAYTTGRMVCLDVHKDNETTEYMLNILNTKFSAVFRHIIKLFESFHNLNVDYLDDNVRLTHHRADHQQNTAFKRMAKIMSVGKNVSFSCVHIPYPSYSVDTLIAPNLETMKIGGAVIDQNVLTVLSRIAPKLKALTLSSCILNPVNPQRYHINMPYTDFDTLSIVSEKFIWERYDEMENMEGMEDTDDEYEQRFDGLEKMDSKISIKKYQMVSLKITSISSKQVRYYTLTPGTPAVIKAVSKDDYSKRTIGWPHISIECKSLKTLNIDLGALVLELNPDTERSIENIGNWRQSTGVALLEDLYGYE